MIGKRFYIAREGVCEVACSDSTIGEITALLTNWCANRPAEQARLLDLIYPELKRVAEARMRLERRDHTLQPTALLNEFIVQLCGRKNVIWKDRAHFLAVASRAMRRILVDYARARNSQKRGGELCKLQLDAAESSESSAAVDILEVHEALEQLSTEDPRMAQIVEMRYFGGLTTGEVAETLGISERTVKRDWQVARVWLFTRLGRNQTHVDGTGEADLRDRERT